MLKNKIIGIIILMFFSFNLISQTINEIERIYFPYKEGYNMEYAGTLMYYDFSKPNPVTGKPKLVEEADSFYYHIPKESYEGNDTIAFFDIKNSKKDPPNSDDILSPLIVNELGMFFWFDAEKKKQLKKALGKDFAIDINTEKVWTIRTPLFKGKTWESYSYDYKSKNTYTCFTIDTLISTPFADLHAFGIKSTVLVTETKDYTQYADFIDYYAIGVGKIYILQDSYVIFKESEIKQLLSRQELLVQKVYWDE